MIDGKHGESGSPARSRVASECACALDTAQPQTVLAMTSTRKNVLRRSSAQVSKEFGLKITYSSHIFIKALREFFCE